MFGLTVGQKTGDDMETESFGRCCCWTKARQKHRTTLLSYLGRKDRSNQPQTEHRDLLPAEFSFWFQKVFDKLGSSAVFWIPGAAPSAR